MSYTEPCNFDFGSGGSGLTLNAQLYNPDGTTNGAAITTGFVEKPTASGSYFLSATVPDNFQGKLVAYKSTDVTLAATVVLGSNSFLGATQGSYAPSKAGDAMTLTSAYDAAKTAASATSVSSMITKLSDGSILVGDINANALSKFVLTDTGQTTASSGSVAKISQGSGGGGGGDASAANQIKILKAVQAAGFR